MRNILQQEMTTFNQLIVLSELQLSKNFKTYTKIYSFWLLATRKTTHHITYSHPYQNRRLKKGSISTSSLSSSTKIQSSQTGGKLDKLGIFELCLNVGQ
jgi:hypothetical protein